jgi:hypothetical protein
MQVIPILKVRDGSEVKSLYYNANKDVVLIGMSDGRILKMNYLASTAFLTGDRSVFVQAKDGFGNLSGTSWSNIFFGIKDKIMEIASDKSVSRWKSVTKPFSADSPGKIVGTFASPIMWAGEDLCFWKTLEWTQSISNGTSVRVLARVGPTPDALLSSDWKSFSAPDGANSASGSLDDFNNRGAYLQLGAKLETWSSGSSPEIARIAATYETKHAVYFFTTKFVLDKGSNMQNGLITGRMTVPEKTEVKFGIAGTNTADWSQYVAVDLDKTFAMPEDVKSRLKVGIKFVSYSDEAYAVVDEFAVAVGADVDNTINRS